MSFDTHPFNVTEKIDVIDDYVDGLEPRVRKMLFTTKNSPVWVLMIQIGSSYIAYIFAKFASKVQIQGMQEIVHRIALYKKNIRINLIIVNPGEISPSDFYD